MASVPFFTRPWLRTLGLAITIVALFFLLWQSDEPSESVDAESLRGESEPDGFVVNGHFLSYNNNGRLATRFRSPRIEQFESRNETIMESPRATLYSESGGAPWNFQATEGRLLEEDEMAYLTGDVRVVREAETGPPLTLTTTALTLDNRERTAYTDEPIELTDAVGLTRATGMKAWIDDRILELDSQVEGRYETGK